MVGFLGLLVLLILAAIVVAFVSTVRKGPKAEIATDELDPDTRLRLKPVRLALDDLRKIAAGGGDASLVAAEGIRSLESTYSELKALGERRRGLVRQARESATDVYADEIARIDALFASSDQAVRELQTEVHRLAASAGIDDDGLSNLAGLRAIAATAKELSDEVRA